MRNPCYFTQFFIYLAVILTTSSTSPVLSTAGPRLNPISYTTLLLETPCRVPALLLLQIFSIFSMLTTASTSLSWPSDSVIHMGPFQLEIFYDSVI